MGTGGSCGARPPSCSDVRVAPARRCGFVGAGPAAVALTVSPFLLWVGAPPRPWGGGGPRLWLPSWGGCGGGGGGAPPRLLSGLCRRGGGGGGSGGGPSVPWRCPLSAKRGGGGEGGLAVPAPGASHRPGGSRPSPAPLYREPDPHAVPPWGPSSPGREGQRSVVSGLRGRFPWVGNKAGLLVSCCPWGAWPPIPFRFAPTRLLWARSARRPGAQAWAHLLFAAPIGAGGWGVGAGHTPAPLSGGGVRPFCLGGWGPGPLRLAGRWGGGGGGGGVAPRPPCSRSRRRPVVLLPGSLRVAGALPSGARLRSGLKCRPGVGGVRGGPWTAPLGAPALEQEVCGTGYTQPLL